MTHDLGRINVDQKLGDEPFHRDGRPLPFTVGDFWRWFASDLLNNTTRGILAEYLVAEALGDAVGARVEWDSVDATTPDGTRVEVKSAAYIQSWHQESLSCVRFSTRPTRGWNAETNTLSEERKRQADVYVFCLLAHEDQETIDPVDVTQWRFFVIATERLNSSLGDQKSVGVAWLESSEAEEVPYSELAYAIAQAST